MWQGAGKEKAEERHNIKKDLPTRDESPAMKEKQKKKQWISLKGIAKILFTPAHQRESHN